MSKASRKARGKVSRKDRGLRGRTSPSLPKSSARLDREIDEVLAQPLAKPKTAALPARKIGLAPGGRPPTSTSDIRSPTSTSTEVRSPTSTSTEVRSPTSTSTDAYTSGNVTVTGGAGAGATTSVKIFTTPPKAAKDAPRRADSKAHGYRSRGAQNRMTDMIGATMAPRTPAPMPGIMRATGDRKTRSKRLRNDRSFESPDISVPKRPRYGKTDAQLDAEIAEALAGKKL